MFKILFRSKDLDFLKLWTGRLISQYGDRIHQFALVGLVAERDPGSAMGLAKLMAFTIFPVFFVQPFAGVFIDRWNKRRTMYTFDFLRGTIILLIPMLALNSPSMWPVYILIFFVYCCPRFYVPAKMALIPHLVEKEDFTAANSLVTTSGMIATGLGAVSGAFIIEYFGAANGFYLDAVSYFICGLLIFRISAGKGDAARVASYPRGEELKGVFREIGEGFRYILAHKDIRPMMNLLLMIFSSAGAIYVVIVVFIQETFQSVTKDLGILGVSLVIGLFCGVLVWGKIGHRFRWQKTLYASLGAGGVMLTGFVVSVFLFPSLVLGVALAFLWGMTMAPAIICANTTVHETVTGEMQGKVFSALEIVYHSGFLVTMMITSWLSEFVPDVLILASVGVLITLTGLTGLLRSKG